MTGFFLKGTGWQGIADDSNAIGCLLLIVNAGGNRYCMGTLDVEVAQVTDGSKLHFAGVIENNPVPTEKIDPFSRTAAIQSYSFVVDSDYFPIAKLRRSGILLQDCSADIYWHVHGRDFTLDQALHILNGKLVDVSYNEENNTASFKVEDMRLEDQTPFPPRIITDASINTAALTLEEGANGNVLPIVIGSVRQLPVSKMAHAANDYYIVMDNPLHEFVAADTPVSALYDEDNGTIAIASQNVVNDNDGNSYCYITTISDACASLDVTVDVDGHTPATIENVIRYLLSFFSPNANIFDLTSLDRLKTIFAGVSFGMGINERVENGALGIIRDRLSDTLPFAVMQRGNKYSFEPIVWDRDVVKKLSTKDNILKKLKGPTETKRSEIFNSFTIKYARSGYRGDFTGSIVRDWNNSSECLKSQERYGKRAMSEIEAGDLADLASANWLMKWYIETFSKMRVFVSYECDLSTANVALFDTVAVQDEYENWENWPLFKVIGIRRPTGSTIEFDLVSVDDYLDVYEVNRPIAVYSPTIAPDIPYDEDPFKSWWKLDLTNNDFLYLPDASGGGDMTPADDFTVLIIVEPDEVVGTFRQFLKHSDTAGGVPAFENQKSWWLFQNGDDDQAYISQNGDNQYSRQILNKCRAGYPHLHALVYNYVGNPTSEMLSSHIDATGTYTSTFYDAAGGPIFDGNGPVIIGGYQTVLAVPTGAFNGKIFACAYYHGIKLTQQNFEDIWNKVVHPVDLNPRLYIDFHKPVAATYEAEIGTGPNEPYNFTVVGTPVKNGA